MNFEKKTRLEIVKEGNDKEESRPDRQRYLTFGKPINNPYGCRARSMNNRDRLTSDKDLCCPGCVDDDYDEDPAYLHHGAGHALRSQ
jgi:hypothetical protein